MGGLFPSLQRQSNSIKKIVYNKNVLSGNPALDSEVLKDRLRHIDSLPESEVYEIVKRCYGSLLEDIFVNNRSDYLFLFVNPKFVSVFVSVLSNINLDYQQIIYCNKIIYDYIVKNNDSDEYIYSLLLALSKSVNKYILPKLLTIGLDEKLAIYLAIGRFSSLKEAINIRRLNHMMISSSPNIFTTENIVKVYEALFDSLSELFMYVMGDVYSEQELTNISDGASEIDSNISLAIIDILNNQSSNIIRQVLISYSNSIGIVQFTNQCRFSMYTLSQDEYARIYAVIDILQHEGIHIY